MFSIGDIISFGCLFTAYLLCFIFFYNKNTEHLCFILLIVLHTCFLFLLFTSPDNGTFLKLIPFFGWDGKIPLKIVFFCSWGLLVVANSFIINTYRLLHATFAPKEKQIHFGAKQNYKDKEILKISFIFSTVLLFSLYLTSKYLRLGNFNYYLILLTVLSLTSSSFSLYISERLAQNTKNISTPSDS